MQQDTTILFGNDQMESIVDALYQLRTRCQIYALSGPLGAGKTTLAQSLLRRFGVQDVITSPTFTYVNIYQLSDGTTLYHFDLYRIGSVEEFIMHGFNEYLYQPQSWAIIEWPEVIAPLLLHKACQVSLQYHDAQTRELKVKVLD